MSSTPLCAHPDDVPLGLAQHGHELIWNRDLNGLQKTHDLTTPMRCDDAWYNGFLNACRHGSLSLDEYALFHGWPSSQPVGCGDDSVACECNAIESVASTGMAAVADTTAWTDAFLNGRTGEELMAMECKACGAERERRARVIPRKGDTPATAGRLERAMDAANKKPFVEAPAIYAYNVPKYSTLLLRAREYAKQAGQRLCWSYAHDVPLFLDDRELPEAQLHAKRYGWLQRHD